MGNIKINGVDYSGGGASSWDELTDKPFESIGTGLSVDEEGNLNAEGGAIPENVVYFESEGLVENPTPRDADTLGGQEPSYYKDANTLEGHPSSYFAKASDVNQNYEFLGSTQSTSFVVINKKYSDYKKIVCSMGSGFSYGGCISLDKEFIDLNVLNNSDWGATILADTTGSYGMIRFFRENQFQILTNNNQLPINVYGVK